MGRFVVLVVLIAFYVFTLLDIGRTPKSEIRYVPRAVWVVTVIVTGALGAAAWYLFGRPNAWIPPPPGGGGKLSGPDWPRGPRSGPLAPDDDPEFLHKLDEQKWAREMERLRQQRRIPPTTPPADPDQGPEPV
ncbi:MAG: hypothetical protein ACOYEV_01295 [Candidatus Nanopelagicales bacterium]